jgi:hypothetical protein
MIAAFEQLASDNAKGSFPAESHLLSYGLGRRGWVACRRRHWITVFESSHHQCATGFYGSESNSNDSPKEAA